MSYTPGNNSANFNSCAIWNGVIGNLTTVGSNGGPSAYGTYDMSGNVNEWNDLDGTAGSSRGLRGGDWSSSVAFRSSSSNRNSGAPSFEGLYIGFRLSSSLNPLNLLNFVTVGDPNNSNDTSGYGGVSYTYQIGACEVTNCEYAEFLNAVASSTGYSVYIPIMSSDTRGGIIRSGSNGSYSYSVKPNMGNKPVIYVSWFSCARYCNWLHNGKPSGDQVDGITETGAYTLVNGYPSGNAVVKNSGANYSIPTENEWYKAAYYKGGSTNAGYWNYATQSDSDPTCVIANSSGDGPEASDYVYGNWTARENNRNWWDITSSSDGSKLAALVFGGNIYTSVDGGVSWTARNQIRSWYSIASNSDGDKLVACSDQTIHTSIDSGESWTVRTINTGNPLSSFYGVASSSDGNKLVAVVNNGHIYTSTDGGASWTARMTDVSREWYGVASSSDGTKLAALVFGGNIYTSADSGASWTARMTDTNRLWRGITSSSDGSKLVAGVDVGYLYTSVDGGVSWTARMTDANRKWMQISSSSDGTKLIAAQYNGYIYTSANSGASWTARMTDANRNWYGVASSSDGNKLVAGVYLSGQIYTNNDCSIQTISTPTTPTPTPTPTTTLTQTPTPNPTPTRTPDITPTNTLTPTQTSTSSPTPTVTATATPSPTITRTSSPTPTETKTPTPTPTNTPTTTSTQTPTASITPTPTSTLAECTLRNVQVAIPDHMLYNQISGQRAETIKFIMAGEGCCGESNTIVINVPSRTPTNTPTPTLTPTRTATPTQTQTPTTTATPTPTKTNTRTPTNTPTNTPTQTLTPSITPSSSPNPFCDGDRRLVFQICNSNAARDDNYDIILNNTNIGFVDLSRDQRIGSLFIAGSESVTTSDFECPISDMVVYRFNESIVLDGVNELKMINRQANYNGNYGTIGIRAYLIDSINLKNPINVKDLEYAGGTGQSFTFTFNLDLCRS